MLMQMHEMQLDHDLNIALIGITILIAPFGKMIFNRTFGKMIFNGPFGKMIFIAPFGKIVLIAPFGKIVLIAMKKNHLIWHYDTIICHAMNAMHFSSNLYSFIFSSHMIKIRI